jgi:hypothetical protein
MAVRESAAQQLVRWQELEKLQQAYPHFNDLLYDVMTDLMGFECTWLQEDIGDYLEHGPLYRMIQAQRGQAKTTITAIYAVWRLIHNPSTRVLIISAGGAMASQISGWIIQIINGMEILACLRPDRSNGDRASVEAFDIHWALKGPEKSPSVACLGATSNMQGFRADLLIADDIESGKNAATPVQREKLTNITRDFTSICSKGDIIYLGTPQSVDSIYNGLPQRGYDVRVWTGRFPSLEEMKNYGANLAPTIIQMCKQHPSLQTGGGPMGDRGQATDPIIVGEDKLTAKEVDQGPAYFQLQHMLDTALMDKDRYPLKPENLFFMDLRDDRAPLDLKLVKMQNYVLPFPAQFPIGLSYHAVPDIGSIWGDFMGTHMYVDPAGGGQNGDETAYAITRAAAGKIFVVAVGGVKGGLGQDELQQLTDLAIKYRCTSIGIEKNFGNGALSNVWQPALLTQMQEHGLSCSIEDVWESGAKELRIIDILEPVIENSKLIFDTDIIDDDWEQCQKYAIQDRPVYSLFWQMARITRDKNCLIHDDRLDALAGAVRHWVDLLSLDAKKAQTAAEQANYAKMIRNPLGMPNSPTSGMLNPHTKQPNRHNILRRF